MAKQAFQLKKVYHLLADKREDVQRTGRRIYFCWSENTKAMAMKIKKGGRRRMSRKDERRKNGRI